MSTLFKAVGHMAALKGNYSVDTFIATKIKIPADSESEYKQTNAYGEVEFLDQVARPKYSAFAS